ncbi:MAG TPA: hypothetical protein ENJ96_03520 [Thermodesulfatator atlanticus]|uniref:Class III cytochrome C domain-containing protein n=1 Tax=Thermodesulfatator atlanticus TaxID=501497 RepID=A0A7V5NZ60_9BACT|nr:hypothetical protein [Thermodesulfatator atlanticus]
MKRFGVLFLVLSFFGWVGWSLAENTKELSELKVPLVKEYQVKMGRVTFPHGKHFLDAGYSCGTCHHVKKNNVEGKMVPEPMTVEKVKELAAQGKVAFQCKTCHGDLKRSQYKKLFHKNCLSCHKALKAEGKKVPVKCRDCHVKPKRKRMIEGC